MLGYEVHAGRPPAGAGRHPQRSEDGRPGSGTTGSGRGSGRGNLSDGMCRAWGIIKIPLTLIHLSPVYTESGV